MAIWRFWEAMLLSILTPWPLMKVTFEKSRSTNCFSWSAVRHSCSNKATHSDTMRPSSLNVTRKGCSATLVIRSTAVLLYLVRSVKKKRKFYANSYNEPVEVSK